MARWFFVLLLTVGAIVGGVSYAFGHDDGYSHRNRAGVLYWHGDLRQHRIALTFDDGPNEPYTSQILDILARHHVKATFFLVGKRVEQAPDVARRIVEEGHAIGDHSYSHPDLDLDNTRQLDQQVLRGAEAIEEATGVRTRLFRAPFGHANPLLLFEAERLGFVAIQWSASARDWERPSADAIVRRILARVHDGAILLLHDGDGAHGGDRSHTVEALDRILTALEQRGYEMVTVPELLDIPGDGTRD